MVAGVQRSLAVQRLLTEMNLMTKLIVNTDSAAAKQSVEKVRLLHVKLMSLRMLCLKDLQRAGCIEVVKNTWTREPSGHVHEASCTAAVQGLSDENPGDFLG